jgi:citrate lyase subunit beta / citryl-CoA lyase
MAAAYREAEAKGLGAAQLDSVMIDVAVLRLVQNTLDKVELYGL